MFKKKGENTPIDEIIKQIPKYNKINEIENEPNIKILTEIIDNDTNISVSQINSAIIKFTKENFHKYKSPKQQILYDLGKYGRNLSSPKTSENIDKYFIKIIENIQQNNDKKAYNLILKKLKKNKKKEDLNVLIEILKNIKYKNNGAENLEKKIIWLMNSKDLISNINKNEEYEDYLIGLKKLNIGYYFEEYYFGQRQVEEIKKIKKILKNTHIKIKNPNYEIIIPDKNNIRLIYEHLRLPKVCFETNKKVKSKLYEKLITNIFEIWLNKGIQFKLEKLIKELNYKYKFNKNKRDDFFIKNRHILSYYNPNNELGLKIKELFNNKEYIKNKLIKYTIEFPYENMEYYYVNEDNNYRFENNGILNIDKKNIFSELIRLDNYFINIEEDDRLEIMFESYKQRNNKHNPFDTNLTEVEFRKFYKQSKVRYIFENIIINAKSNKEAHKLKNIEYFLEYTQKNYPYFKDIINVL